MVFWHVQVEHPWLNKESREFISPEEALAMAIWLEDLCPQYPVCNTTGPLLIAQQNLITWFVFPQRTLLSRLVMEISLLSPGNGKTDFSLFHFCSVAREASRVWVEMSIKIRLFCKLSSVMLNITFASSGRHSFPKSAHPVYCRLLQMLNPNTKITVQDFLKKKW